MKKKIKKLTLNGETLRNLDERNLDQAVGGGTMALCTQGTIVCSLCLNC